MQLPNAPTCPTDSAVRALGFLPQPICCLPSPGGKQDERACGLVAGPVRAKQSKHRRRGRERSRAARRRRIHGPITCDASGSASAFASACGRPPCRTRRSAPPARDGFLSAFLLSACRPESWPNSTSACRRVLSLRPFTRFSNLDPSLLNNLATPSSIRGWPFCMPSSLVLLHSMR